MSDDKDPRNDHSGDHASDHAGEEHPHGSTFQPYNADEPRPKWTPLLAVIGVILLIALIFAAITWLRYST